MSTKIEKEILAAQYETMIRIELANQSVNTTPYKNVVAFVGSFLSSCFFTWCSSGDTSFFPKLFSENLIVRYMVCFLPFIFFLVYEVSIIISTNRIMKKVDSEFEMSMHSWRKRFREFILKRIEYEREHDLCKNISSIKEKMKNHEDIVFEEMDFADYLKEYYKKYKFNVYYDFYTHLAKVILLENEINGTLIFDKGKYTFVVKDNVEVLCMSASYL